MNEPIVQVIIDGVDISINPQYRERLDPLMEARGILRALRVITKCSEGDSIITHTAAIVRRLDRLIERHGKDFAP